MISISLILLSKGFYSNSIMEEYVLHQTKHKQNHCCDIHQDDTKNIECCEIHGNSPCCNVKNSQNEITTGFFGDVENTKNRLLNMNLDIDMSNVFYGVIDSEGQIHRQTEKGFHNREPIGKQLGETYYPKKKFNIVVKKPDGRLLEVKKSLKALEKSHLKCKKKSSKNGIQKSFKNKRNQEKVIQIEESKTNERKSLMNTLEKGLFEEKKKRELIEDNLKRKNNSEFANIVKNAKTEKKSISQEKLSIQVDESKIISSNKKKIFKFDNLKLEKFESKISRNTSDQV
jgi:hypothetical protein